MARLLLASVAGACLATTMAAPARAQSLAPASANFQIPAQPLSSAVDAFIRQSGWQISYSSALANGRTSAAVSGSMAPDVALQRLVAGTGVSVRVSGPGSAALVDPAVTTGSTGNGGAAVVLQTVTVQGTNPNATIGSAPGAYAGGQVATGAQLGMLGNRDVMNTPFSQTSYTNQTIQNQQARTVNEVLSNDPSVIVTATGVRNDAEFIRGFQNISTTGTRSLNGLAGMAPIEFPSADFLERVEVLKGPSALLNGMAAAGSGAIGGTVNLTTKQATDEPITQITPRYVSDSQIGTHIDFARRFGPANEFGVRFNGSLDGGDTPVEPQWARSGLAALNADYQGERVRVSADFAHQSQKDSPRTNYLTTRSVIATLPFMPEAPDSGTSLFPTWERGRSTGTLGMVRGEVDIFENVTAYAAIGGQTSEKRFSVGGPATLLGTSGAYTIQPWVQHTDYDVLSMQGGVRATATTGPIDHSLNLSLSRADYEERSAFWIGARSPAGTIYDPVFGAPPVLVDPGDPRKVNESTVSSVGLSDTLSFLDERIQFTAGVRYQAVDVANFNTTTGARTSSYDENAWSPAFGLVVKPWENVSLYANYIEGLQAGSTVGTAYANAGEVFAPFTSEQYEAGVKVDWGVVTTTLAAFQISQPSTIAIPASGGGLPTLALDGEQRNRGIELTAYGEPIEGVRLLGGVTFLDARQTKTANGTFDGERAASAPRFRTVIGAEWDTPFLEGLTLTGRVAHTSDQVVVNTRPDLKLPSWTQVDVGARYTFLSPWNEKPVTVRFNIDNLFDEDYWEGSFSNGFVHMSEPRTFRLATTFNF